MRPMTVIDESGQHGYCMRYGTNTQTENYANPPATGEYWYDSRNKFVKQVRECPLPNSNPLCLGEGSNSEECIVTNYEYDYRDPLESSASDESGTGKISAISRPSVLDAADEIYKNYDYLDGTGLIEYYTETGYTFVTAANDEIEQQSHESSYVYNDDLQMTAVMNPLQSGTGYQTSYTYYDESAAAPGMKESVVLANGDTTTYTDYDVTSGKPTKVTDENGVTVQSTLNGFGSPTSIQVYDGETLQYTLAKTYYDNDLLRVVALNGEWLYSLAYDFQENIRSITDTAGNVLNITWDLYHNPTAISATDGESVTFEKAFEYDGNDRLIKQFCDGDSSSTCYLQYGYDEDGNLVSVRDYKGQETTYEYDNFRNIAAVHGPDWGDWLFSYDTEKNLTAIAVDGTNVEYGFVYDDFGRLVKVDSPDFGVWRQAYNALNQPLYNRFAGVHSTFTYDAMGLGQLYSREYFPEGGGDALAIHQYTWGQPGDSQAHSVGRVKAETIDEKENGDGDDYSITHAYAFDGKPIKDTIVIQDKTFEIVYAYDANRNLRTITYPSGNVVTYDYADFKVNSLKVDVAVPEDQDAISHQFLTAATYLPFGPWSSITHGNGRKTNFTYNQRYFLTDLETGNSSLGDKIVDYHYEPDANLNIAALIDQTADQGMTFTYDSLNQLKTATAYQAGSGIYNDQAYSYDPHGLGNRAALVDGGVTHGFTYNGNRLAEINGYSASRAYTYDAYGRVTGLQLENAGGNLTFAYDHQGMISKVNGGAYQYQYDTKQRRVRKVKQGGDTLYYIYDALDNLIAEYTQADGATEATATREYYYAGKLLLGAADLETQLVEPSPFGCAAKKNGFQSPYEVAWLLLPMAVALALPRWRRADRSGKIRLSLAALLAGGMIAGSFVLLTARSGRAMGDDEEVLVYKPYWAHLNQIGAPVRLTDADGAVVWAAEYEPFGKTVSLDEDPDGDGETVTMNFRFPGQYYDSETGLHYNWHRYYDPIAGRYLQADEVTMKMKNKIIELAYNNYKYATNNPLKVYDLNGNEGCAMFFFTMLAGVGGGVLGVSLTGELAYGFAVGGGAVAILVLATDILTGLPLTIQCIQCRAKAFSEYDDVCMREMGSSGFNPMCRKANDIQAGVDIGEYAKTKCNCEGSFDWLSNALIN
ncbi:MAG: RHS repeat protein [Myxococcales bacterium]|nr:RHS repeat protein [Myxococcales bacterium]